VNIIQCLNRSLCDLKHSYISEFQHLVEASCSHDRMIDTFISQLRAEVHDLILLPEAQVPSDSVNSKIVGQFNQLSVPAPVPEFAPKSDTVNVASFHTNFVTSTTDLLEQLTSERAEMRWTFAPAMSQNLETEIELQSAAAQQELFASWLESRFQKLKADKTTFHERQIAELGQCSSQKSPALGESIGNLRSQIRNGRAQAAQRKVVMLMGIARDMNRDVKRVTDHLMLAGLQQDSASRDSSLIDMARERLKVLQSQREEAERELARWQ
jgi:hypothetical protein